MRPLYIFMVLLFSGVSFSQVINKGILKITGNNVVIKNLNFINSSGATLEHNGGNVYFSGGEWVNDGTMILPPSTSNAQTVFNSANQQTINGTGENFFNHLIIQHPASSGTSVVQRTNATANKMTVEDNGALFEYDINNGTGRRLTVKGQLTLNGNIRLYEDSQLLQEDNLAVSGSGKLYRSQMGTGNKYWYNYWSSPVNRSGVWQVQYLLDSRNEANPQPIVFEYSFTGSGSPNVNSSQNPAHINEAFIYVFRNAPDGDYNSWLYMGSTNNINPGEGYTMKGPDIFNASRPGSGSTTEFKGYTFSGTPNNGTYTLTIDHGNDYLLGNPYPSALSVDNFINENTGKFSGALYFWEHVNGSSHYLNDYTGGYAVRNLTGGVPAKDWQTQSSTVGTKTPGAYVPVAQGFFIYNNTGSTQSVSFNNTQRYYYKEDGSNSVFMRSSLPDIRLTFTDPQGGIRQLLLGIRPNITFGEDWGWDALVFEGVWHGDMYFDIYGKHYVIQAVPEINDQTRIPLYVELTEDGTVQFGLHSVENLPADIRYFIEDASTATFHEIDTTRSFSIFLNRGQYANRFYLRFRGEVTQVEEWPQDTFAVNLTENELTVFNKKGTELKQISLFDLTGKQVYSFPVHSSQSVIRKPVSLARGAYIVRVTTADNTFSTKVLANH